MGFEQFYVGPELEYFYFRSADTSGPPEVLDRGGYFDLTTLDAGSDLRRETVLALEQLGIHVEYSHHEVGPSQHEVDMRYADALKMADDCMTYRITVKEYAMKYGFYATFMPKPLYGENGSGMHTHQSLFKEGRNAFYDENDQFYLSEVAKSFIAGQLKHAREISALFAQWVNSYKRLVPGLRGTGLRGLVAPQPLGPDPRAALSPGQGAGDALRDPQPGPRVQPLPVLRRSATGGPRGDREGLRAARADGEEPLPHLSGRAAQSSGSSSCPRRSARRSRSRPSPSSCSRRSASTRSRASSRSSARSGRTTAASSPVGDGAVPADPLDQDSSRGELVVGEAERCGGDVLLEVRDGRGARDRQHRRRALQQPGERDLAGRGAVGLGDLGERAFCVAGELPPARGR